MFGRKNNEEHNLENLQEGYTLTCNTIHWKIVEITKYDWSVDGRSVEYKLESPKEGYEAYLEVGRHQGEYEIYFTEEVDIDRNIIIDGIRNRYMEYMEQKYNLEEEYKGASKNETLFENWDSVRSYVFYAPDEALLNVELRNERDYTVFYGFELDETDLKKINSNR